MLSRRPRTIPIRHFAILRPRRLSQSAHQLTHPPVLAHADRTIDANTLDSVFRAERR